MILVHPIFFFFHFLWNQTEAKIFIDDSEQYRQKRKTTLKCNTLTELLKGEKNRTEMETAKQNLLEKTNK